MEPSENGEGGLTYFVKANNKKYVVKYPSDNEMNNPDVEIRVCEELLQKGIPACQFIANKQGKMISTDENGRRFTLQHFYYGTTYAYNDAPVSLQTKSAVYLAKIHEAMKDIQDIPVGIGADFLAYRKPEYMKEEYADTLKQAIENNDTNIVERIRSYVFMAPEIKDGKIDINSLVEYISKYMEYGSLNSYDIENAGKFFFYFLAVCNFYGQYYDSISKNRYIYLQQANMASFLLEWFENHIDELNEKLRELSMQINYQKKMANYYDSKGLLSQYPIKRPMRVIALTKIAECFEYDRRYTEKEVNEIIKQNISFSDIELVRREMFQLKLIGRLRDGSAYWREK